MGATWVFSLKATFFDPKCNQAPAPKTLDCDLPVAAQGSIQSSVQVKGSFVQFEVSFVAL